MTKDIEIFTYYLYEDIKNWDGIVFPLSSLSTESIASIIENEVQEFYPIEVVNFCSFLNMVCQTRSFREVKKISDNGVHFPPQ